MGRGFGVLEMDPQIGTWTIDSIQCDRWSEASDIAIVKASNYAFDSCNFEMIRHPDGFGIPINIDTSMRSEDWFFTLPGNWVEELVVPLAEEKLNQWMANVALVSSWVAPSEWVIPFGEYAILDVTYAALARLYEVMGEYGCRKLTTFLASRMEVPLSTAKERIRESRRRNLLTSPGKGVSGQSHMTAKARKILEKEGRLNAKKK